MRFTRRDGGNAILLDVSLPTSASGGGRHRGHRGSIAQGYRTGSVAGRRRDSAGGVARTVLPVSPAQVLNLGHGLRPASAQPWPTVLPRPELLNSGVPE